MLGGLVSYLHYLCVFAYSGVRHLVFCVFVLFVFVVSTLCCQLLWIVLFLLRLRYTLTFIFVLCLVYPVLPFSLDCPFLIASSLFSNVYILYISLIGDKSTKYFAVVNWDWEIEIFQMFNSKMWSPMKKTNFHYLHSIAYDWTKKKDEWLYMSWPIREVIGQYRTTKRTRS